MEKKKKKKKLHETILFYSLITQRESKYYIAFLRWAAGVSRSLPTSQRWLQVLIPNEDEICTDSTISLWESSRTLDTGTLEQVQKIICPINNFSNKSSRSSTYLSLVVTPIFLDVFAFRSILAQMWLQVAVRRSSCHVAVHTAATVSPLSDCHR